VTAARLNLGCGAVTPAGWTNVDYALGARLARWPLARAFFKVRWDRSIVLHDLTKRLPWPDRSAQAIYSSHTLEHFEREQGARFLAECRRVLSDQGVIRIVVPDLAVLVQRYGSGKLRAEHFLEELDVLTGTGLRGIKRFLSPFVSFPHKCMYDAEALLRALHTAGFRAERHAAFESAIEGIREIELEERTVDAVIAEGRPHS
jgi:predicted SAM-dependent methyltransferase